MSIKNEVNNKFGEGTYSFIKEKVWGIGYSFYTGRYAIRRGDDFYVVKRNPSIGTICNHFLDNYVLNLPIHHPSKMCVIDIDQRNNLIASTAIVEHIVDYIGLPFFIERSSISKGYHLFFSFDRKVSFYAWKYFVSIMKKRFDIAIEVIIGNKFIRFPFSDSYRTGGTFSLHTPYNIESYDNPIQVIECFLNRSSILIPAILNRVAPKRSLCTQQTVFFSNKKYTYGKGSRVQTQMKMGFNVIRSGGSFIDFYNMCVSCNDGSSEDMKDTEYNIKKMLNKMWDWCVSHYEGSKSLNFDSIAYNPNQIRYDLAFKLSDNDEKKLRVFLDEKYISEKIGRVGGIPHRKLIESCIRVITYLYDIKNFRIKYNKKYYGKFEYLNIGIPFGVEMQRKFAEYFKIRNIRKIWKFLTFIGLVVSIENDSGYSYSYNHVTYVKHYIVMENKFKK